MKTNSFELNKIFDELQYAINLGYCKRSVKMLEKLNFIVKTNSSHPKIYFYYKNKKYVITWCSSASDINCEKQVLRIIRKIYENN